MKNGDLSNISNPLIVVRIEDTLLHVRNEKLMDKMLNLIQNKYLNSDIDFGSMRQLVNIYRNDGFDVILGIDSKENFQTIDPFLKYFEVLKIKDTKEIHHRLQAGMINYYLDNNRERLSLINHQNAMTIDDFRHISGVK